MLISSHISTPHTMLTGEFFSKKTLISVTSSKRKKLLILFSIVSNAAYKTILSCLNMFVFTELTVVAKQQVIIIADKPFVTSFSALKVFKIVLFPLHRESLN